MLIRLALLSILMMSSVHATDPRAQRLAEIDIEACSRAATHQYTWIMHMSEWRQTYNMCLRRKLKALGDRYTHSALEAIRLEELCPESSLNGAPIDLSMMGLQIANQMTARDMQLGTTSNNLEQTIELYYDRLIQSNSRIKELRR